MRAAYHTWVIVQQYTWHLAPTPFPNQLVGQSHFISIISLFFIVELRSGIFHSWKTKVLLNRQMHCQISWNWLAWDNLTPVWAILGTFSNGSRLGTLQGPFGHAVLSESVNCWKFLKEYTSLFGSVFNSLLLPDLNLKAALFQFHFLKWVKAYLISTLLLEKESEKSWW